MKNASIIALIVTLAGLLGGCASSPYSKGEAAASGLRSTAKSLASADKSLDATIAALNDLSSGAGDLKKRFNRYSSSVDTLASDAKSVRGEAEAIKTEGESYFKWWEQQVANVKNEDLKNASAARRQQIRDEFNKINATYQTLRSQYIPYMSDLRDIQTVLGSGLTSAMVESVRPTMTKAAKEGADVRASLTTLMNQYTALGVSMSAAGK